MPVQPASCLQGGGLGSVGVGSGRELGEEQCARMYARPSLPLLAQAFSALLAPASATAPCPAHRPSPSLQPTAPEPVAPEPTAPEPHQVKSCSSIQVALGVLRMQYVAGL